MTFIGALAGLPAGALMMLPGEVLLPQNRAAGMGIFFTWYYAGLAVLTPIGGILRDASGVALSMPYEHSNQCPPKPPLCTFECRACGVSHIEAAYIEVA